MKLYRIDYHGEPDYVEAESYGLAIAKWRDYVFDDLGADAEPTSVVLIADSADYVDRPFVVIR